MDKKYKVGYVPGVFDLFHIGHLNLLKNSKEKSEYLIVGVLTDELVLHFKGKLPLIPFEERMAIVESIKYVDEVIPVTFDNTKKIDAWNQLHYDCHFSGSDHGPDWENDLKQLREVGSNMEFLPYTKQVSSSALKRKLNEKEKKEKIFLFGAGIKGREFAKLIRDGKFLQEYDVIGFLDNDENKKHTRIEGFQIYGLDEIGLIAPDFLFSVFITPINKEDIKKQLLEVGITNILTE